jgi:hypothetical protein
MVVEKKRRVVDSGLGKERVVEKNVDNCKC